MADIDLKTETPDTSLPTTGFLFGADSQSAASPSVYSTQAVATALLGSTSLTGATVTADSPVLDLAQTWNNAAVTFTGLKFNVPTDSSASGSLLMDLQVGGSSRFNVSKTGSLKLGVNPTGTNQAGTNVIIAGSQGTGTGAGGSIVFQVAPAGSSGTAQNALVTFLEATSARAFNLYNTTDVATNYERGKIAWSSNVLQIGTEKANTGTARDLVLQTDGTTRLTITAAGVTTVDAVSEFTLNIGGVRFLYGETFGQDSITLGSNATDIDLTIKGSSNANVLLIDAGINGIGFFGAAAVAQPTTATTAATVAATGAGDVVAASTTFDGYTIPQIVKALRNVGLLA